jgi:hypothetical protein
MKQICVKPEQDRTQVQQSLTSLSLETTQVHQSLTVITSLLQHLRRYGVSKGKILKISLPVAATRTPLELLGNALAWPTRNNPYKYEKRCRCDESFRHCSQWRYSSTSNTSSPHCLEGEGSESLLRMLTYADVCWRMLTYSDVCVSVCVYWRMLTYVLKHLFSLYP